jgi:nitroreductase
MMNEKDNHLKGPLSNSPPPSYPEKNAGVEYDVHELIRRRWSPHVFDEHKPVERLQILTMLEAARWAPSCFNEQPWRYIVFDSSNPNMTRRARACLSGYNVWATLAPVLILSVAKDVFTYNEHLNRHAQYDAGLAGENLMLEAVHQGLVGHQMGGFDTARARREFDIPDNYTPMTMIAIGHPYRGRLDDLSDAVRAMELESRQRKPMLEIAFEGRWDIPFNEQDSVSRDSA